jgi:hypothetical protein
MHRIRDCGALSWTVLYPIAPWTIVSVCHRVFQFANREYDRDQL